MKKKTTKKDNVYEQPKMQLSLTKINKTEAKQDPLMS